VLDGKTIGVVYGDAGQGTSLVETILIPTLEELGHEVAVTIALPCPPGSTSCSQQDVAAQRMQDAGVDFVFNGAQVLAGVQMIDAASRLGWEPEWTTYLNNTTDTVAGFYQGVADAYTGTRGISNAWDDSEITEETVACNEQLSKAGLSYQPADNAYAAVGAYCIMVDTLARGLAALDGPLDPQSLSAAILGLGEVAHNAGPPGSLAPGKFASADQVYEVVYDPAANSGRGGFVPATDPIEPIIVDK
jgi:hypothetical protein